MLPNPEKCVNEGHKTQVTEVKDLALRYGRVFVLRYPFGSPAVGRRIVYSACPDSTSITSLEFLYFSSSYIAILLLSYPSFLA